jgi:hypothetical protein
MVVKSKKDRDKSKYDALYQFLTYTNGELVIPIEFSDITSLDTFVEKLLDEGGYAKSDFIVVKVIDYKVKAEDYSEASVDPEPESETEPTSEEITDGTES